MIKSAGIIVRQGKAYIPISAEIEGGPFVQIEPVFVATLTVDDLLCALEKMVQAGHPRIAPLTREDWKKRKDPILVATKVKSWEKLAKDSAAYGIAWDKDKITLYLHALDEAGRFTSRPDRTQSFPPETTLREIAEAILTDIQALPGIGFPKITS